MNENGGKSSTILLTVIGIATLLVVVVGATFAYFAAQVTGDDTSTSVLITASSQGTNITFTGGEDISLTNIYPKSEAWLTKEISLSNSMVSGSQSTATYTFGLEVAEGKTFRDKDLQFTFVKTSTEDGVTAHTQTTDKANLVNNNKIAQGTVALNAAHTITYELNVYYVNDAEFNQNNGTNKTVSFHITQNWVENTTK